MQGSWGYPWSSHRSYVGRGEGGLVDVDRVLGMFSGNKRRARDLYRDFMSDGRGLRKEEVYHQDILGGDGFIERVKKRARGWR